MEIINAYPNGVKTTSTTDYVDADGVLHKGAKCDSVLVPSTNTQTILAQLTGYVPGSYAHTAGWANAWELDVDGTTWVPLGGE